ncbi:MAG: type II toxin-antitoxin system Phd/YefM family antitoxin [Aequoribacter sp.]|jgi:prevent-host-death family protein|uniref:type II toxin-antitoxin system Phd/YefM family antitoxin n=1 Tax=Aequoribacter sp. TaxID=2847771 RepID=UPI003C4F05AB
MFSSNNIHTITEFSRNTAEHLKRLAASKQPELYTHNGKPSVVIQDAESYERMAELADYADSLLKIRQALSEQGRSLESFTEEFEQSMGIEA